MKEEKKRRLPPFVMLCFVAVVMSFAIAGVYMLTKDTIEAAALEAQAAARAAVMEDAAVMTEYALPDGAPVDWCYEAFDADGSFLGYVSQITVIGFGGEIEVTVGMDTDASITAISVGGSNFSETSGLGAKTREAKFTDQFRGKSGMLILKQDIDSVTGASVSSGAVVSGVNKALDYMRNLLPEDITAGSGEPLPLTEEQTAIVLPGASEAVWMGSASGIDGWWRADNGYIVRATGFGEGPIVVTMGFTPEGVVTGLTIGDENFMESEGRGALVQEEYYWGQFVGRSGVQEYGYALDAISGATVTSDATLAAVNACMGFDPSSPASAAVTEETVTVSAEPAAAASGEASGEAPDAVTEASVPAEEAEPVPTVAPDPYPPGYAPTPTPEPTPAPTPEPVLTPDAVTEASVVEAAAPTPTPTPALTPDAVTEASIPEETP